MNFDDLPDWLIYVLIVLCLFALAWIIFGAYSEMQGPHTHFLWRVSK